LTLPGLSESRWPGACAVVPGDAVHDGTPANDPAAAAAAMGPYYPRTAVCPLTLLTTQGIQACM